MLERSRPLLDSVDAFKSNKCERAAGGVSNSKHVLRKCQSARWSADMAETPSALASSAVVPVTRPTEGRFAPMAGQPTPLLIGVRRSV